MIVKLDQIWVFFSDFCIIHVCTHVSVFMLSCRTIQQQIKPTLDKLLQDSDIDVQFYAAEALDGKLY